MKLNTIRKLGLAGALAIGGLLFAPLAASADVNTCSKDVTKNAAKVATDVQKELAKCVDGWLKDEDKVLANATKWQVSFDGVTGDSAGLPKAAEKCEKSLVKIGLDGHDIAQINGSTEKAKLGKSYQKLARRASVRAKAKCGIDPATKAQDRDVARRRDFAAGLLPALGGPRRHEQHRCAPDGHGRGGERLEYPGHAEPRLLSRLPGDGQRSMRSSRGPVRRHHGLRPDRWGRHLPAVQVPRLHQAGARGGCDVSALVPYVCGDNAGALAGTPCTDEIRVRWHQRRDGPLRHRAVSRRQAGPCFMASCQRATRDVSDRDRARGCAGSPAGIHLRL